MNTMGEQETPQNEMQEMQWLCGIIWRFKVTFEQQSSKIIKCKHCSFATSQNKRLEEHIEFIHKEKEKHQCEVCQKEFVLN